jgi:hypothetical protein
MVQDAHDQRDDGQQDADRMQYEFSHFFIPTG